MNNLKVGDTVQLKSGGPVMTVANVKQLDEQEIEAGVIVNCQWFVKDELKIGSFHPDVLELIGERKSETSSTLFGFA